MALSVPVATPDNQSRLPKRVQGIIDLYPFPSDVMSVFASQQNDRKIGISLDANGKQRSAFQPMSVMTKKRRLDLTRAAPGQGECWEFTQLSSPQNRYDAYETFCNGARDFIKPFMEQKRSELAILRSRVSVRTFHEGIDELKTLIAAQTEAKPRRWLWRRLMDMHVMLAVAHYDGEVPWGRLDEHWEPSAREPDYRLKIVDAFCKGYLHGLLHNDHQQKMDQGRFQFDLELEHNGTGELLMWHDQVKWSAFQQGHVEPNVHSEWIVDGKREPMFSD
jgi:hypothetical protein